MFFLTREFFFFISALIISIITPSFTGYLNVSNTLLTFVLLYMTRVNKHLYYFYLSSLIAISFYIPIGFSFGKVNLGHIVSLIQTNNAEAIEFIKLTSINSLFLMLLNITLIIGCFFSKTFKVKSIYFYSILLLFIILNINSYQTRFFKYVVIYFIDAKHQLLKLKTESIEPDEFIITKHDYKYKNVVIVIGESVTRDYLSLYGYPHQTTPWLDNASGTFFTNYISSAPNTFMSLPRTLAFSDEHGLETNNNIVALVNKTGFDSWWISNQGFVGEFDTPITLMAIKSKNLNFLKNGDFETNNTDDMDMLFHLNKILTENKMRTNVIFMHMIGSHPDTCRRLNGFPIEFNISPHDQVNCYLASIKKLDFFIQSTIGELNKTNESYALFYFSDHGMTIDESKRPVRHGNEFKQNFNVPFFIITNNDKDHKTNNAYMSAKDFISIFESTLGIDSEKIPARMINDFHNEDINVFNGQSIVPYSSLKNNAILK